MMDVGELKESIGALAKNIYFCGANTQDPAPTVFTKDAVSSRQLTELFQKKSVEQPGYAQISVKTTQSLNLEKTRSLEEILEKIPHDVIYFDPTATIERARILVNMVRQSRILLGPVLKGCYFNSDKRHVHFMLKASSSARKPDITAVREQLEPIILQNTQRLSRPFYFSITLSFQKAQGTVIAIDKSSVIKSSMNGVIRTLMNKLKWPLLVASATSSFGMGAATAAEADSLPAVANVNGWLGASGGYMHNKVDSGPGGFGEAGLALPLTHDFALQLHASDGAAAHANVQSVDGYVFWRNPAQGLLGPHVMYTASDHIYQTLYGLHGEGYWDTWTLVGEAGGVHQNQRSGSYYAEAIVHWYAQPNLDINLGGISVDGYGAGQIGAEYQLGLSSLPGLSVYADAGVGAQSLSYGFLGLRYYFGDPCNPCKPLIQRHREDMVPPTLDLLVHNTREEVAAPRLTS